MANKKIEIIVGTSENYLVGYKIDQQKVSVYVVICIR